MIRSRRICVAFVATLAGLLVPLVLCAIAFAGPVTVNLRVEGSTKTLYEGPVTTQAETFETSSSGGPHPCNYSENGPSGETNTSSNENGGNLSGTPTTALRNAALTSGLAFNAEWFGSGKSRTENPGDFFVTQVGTDINETSAPYDSWGYAVNYTTAPVGGCQIALAPGNEVLWAYNYFNLKHLLNLSGPTSANVGVPFVVHVVDGQTGGPISGATIGEDLGGVTTALTGNPTTNGQGDATVSLAHAGVVKLKATQPESVRSNGIEVCVHNGNDGTCGTTTTSSTVTTSTTGTQIPPLVIDTPKITGVKNGHVYARHGAPRLLAGMVSVPTGATLREVKISLKRTYHGRCFDFSGSKERFVHAKCARQAPLFSVGSSESFSYLLPSRLPAGRYVYDIEAINDAGQMTKLLSGVSSVAFEVK